MKTEELIQNLSYNLEPTRLYSWQKNASIWLVIGALYITLVTVLMGPRFDLAVKISEVGFLAPLLTLAALAIASSISFSFLGVPRISTTPRQRIFPWVVLGLWIAYLGVSIGKASHPHDLLHPISWSCVRDLVIFGSVPTFVAWKLLKNGAPTQTGLASFHALVASLALGTIGGQFVCSNDSAAHILVWHALPLILFVAVFKKILALTLRWVG